MRLKKIALRGMIILAAIIALCILFAGTLRSLTTPKVDFAEVKNGKLENSVEMTGSVVFPEKEDFTIAVPDEMSVTVEKILVSTGEHVSAGDALMKAKVTDYEKKLAEQKEKYDKARDELDAWERKNGDIRLTNNEKQWMAAYEKERDATTREQNLRISLMAKFNLTDAADLTDELIEGIKDGKIIENYTEWKTVQEEMTAAKKELKSLERYAVADDVWATLQTKRDKQKEMADAEAKMMEIRKLQNSVETITAPHEGYVVAIKASKEVPLVGDKAEVIQITPEGKGPVLRVMLKDKNNQPVNVQKGAALTIPVSNWMKVDAKVTALGVDKNGDKYADAALTDKILGEFGNVSGMIKKGDIKVKMTTRAKDTTQLIEAGAVRTNGSTRYVFLGITEEAPLGGTRIVVQEFELKDVLGESEKYVSVAEGTIESGKKVLFHEDRIIKDKDTVMKYE
ncbi:hypothetical protein [Aristaeella lactis]|uniref:Multidrug efflux pump subunit AcrA (Membrane-fusion protein) n=1 Tax=Aristaeella lactis TaxID=3046383 RepID=A0AC61PKK1_9FIRM|nr:hypothetical protein [Aristaeella lactis]QUA51978.1 hypothetical protein JYE50_09630 [Aristaeella lactis]SMC54369.1 Multidrug efflux pump subunit AcrA (membrane-fusion protein) [Aristaeella lactis]